MIKIISIIVSFTLFLFCSEPSDNPSNSPNDFWFSVKVENTEWHGQSYFDFASADLQILFLEPDENYNYLTIKIPFNGIGKYQLGDSSASLVETVGGDVFEGIYYSFSEPNDLLTINYFDENKGEVEGSFNFKIQKVNSVIEIYEGIFRAYIINKK